MRVAPVAGDGGTRHPETCVADFFHVLFSYRLRETWPAGARVKFCCRVEQRGITANATVETFVVEVPVLPRKRHLGSVMAGDIKRAGGEVLPPFALPLHHLWHLDHPFSLPRIGEFHDGDVLRFLVGQTYLGGRRMSFIHRPPYIYAGRQCRCRKKKVSARNLARR